MFVTFQYSYVENLMPMVVVWEDSDFGRWLAHAYGALMNGISAP